MIGDREWQFVYRSQEQPAEGLWLYNLHWLYLLHSTNYCHFTRKSKYILLPPQQHPSPSVSWERVRKENQEKKQWRNQKLNKHTHVGITGSTQFFAFPQCLNFYLGFVFLEHTWKLYFWSRQSQSKQSRGSWRTNTPFDLHSQLSGTTQHSQAVLHHTGMPETSVTQPPGRNRFSQKSREYGKLTGFLVGIP